MTLIDTAEVYRNGRSEEIIGRVIDGQRDGVFLGSKVWPNHVKGDAYALAMPALPVSALIISISIFCTGELRSPTCPSL